MPRRVEEQFKQLIRRGNWCGYSRAETSQKESL